MDARWLAACRTAWISIGLELASMDAATLATACRPPMPLRCHSAPMVRRSLSRWIEHLHAGRSGDTQPRIELDRFADNASNLSVAPMLNHVEENLSNLSVERYGGVGEM